ALAGVVLRDLFFSSGDLLDDRPRIALRMHDSKKGDSVDSLLPDATMRFGLLMRQDDGTFKGGSKARRLTYDEWGRSNNTCLRIDQSERLIGEKPGRWLAPEAKRWKDEQ